MDFTFKYYNRWCYKFRLIIIIIIKATLWFSVRIMSIVQCTIVIRHHAMKKWIFNLNIGITTLPLAKIHEEVDGTTQWIFQIFNTILMLSCILWMSVILKKIIFKLFFYFWIDFLFQFRYYQLCIELWYPDTLLLEITRTVDWMCVAI